ncbi:MULTISPECIES: DUF3592 domain-containing protein [unclassified Nocardioides]|uniref:DUF3592 domain-containing protein n=1 Tax=unclassified Nocardioides TaxID=2615069 RepID=UPI001154DB99|nr:MULTISPECIES: DUF3592 domain-containing protein [unclassified Nocardioides]TQK72155.1 uncharacterized protein DUF3592 [Nocardioides sp. SLBN-35]WGY03629.1 DUF3592 domain-containing protein [Nocardioides sp. QY071]
MRDRLGSIALVAFVLLFMIGGPALIVWGAVAVDRHDTLVRGGQRAEGTVVEFVDAHKASKRKVEVEFAAPDGSTHRARGLAGPDQSPEVGSTLPVAYDEEDPGRNAVVGYDDTGSSLLGMGVILTGVFWGLPLLVLLVRLPARRRRRREEARAAAG